MGIKAGNRRDSPRTTRNPGQSAKRKNSVGLEPLRSILVLTRDGNGPRTVLRQAISAEEVGWKACGLSSLPPEWVPPFFVVDSACTCAGSSEDNLQARIRQCVAELGIGDRPVIVRSSGTTETMRDRGRLVSAICSVDRITTTIDQLSTKLASEGAANVHWIVQRYLRPVRSGHLSNERHLSYENRDWVVEVEAHGDLAAFPSRIAVRPWRDGALPSSLDLSCASQPQITLKLKRVAIWATRLSSRLHFEWVWDGSAIWVVQADIAEARKGLAPKSLRPDRMPDIALGSLVLFQPASSEHYDQYPKLRNVKVYRELGYEMPAFFVLDDAAAIKSVLSGKLPQPLEHDVRELTKRPLIIRTDGKAVPPDKREMLPRSDELRTPAEATNWLLSDFSSQVEKTGLGNVPLCLIAHHFIPSIASAWARAEPATGLVRIESLWGLPEGLYWYSHDTFEVDVAGANKASGTTDYPIWKRRRYKGTFIAPDEAGRWVPYNTSEPYEWWSSISRTSWICEIASVTRRLADHEKCAVSVMWLIDNDRRATRHAVLPWYHTKSVFGGLPKAAPRRKLTAVRDHVIRTAADWAEVKSQVLSGRRAERVVMEPSDPLLVRNREFVEELAEFAASNGIVVELAGGILSHAFYILQRKGARVECVDLFGAEEETVEYNKLVRDKIPILIKARGERVQVVQLSGEALLAALRQKLVEEAYEVLDARAGEELLGELADVQELVNAIAGALEVGKKQIEANRLEKRKRRGGFDEGLMLEKTSTAHSPAAEADLKESTRLSISADRLILEPSALPSSPPYQRPDLRNVGEQREKLFAFQTELNRIRTAKQSTTFSLPIDDEALRDFTLTVEFTRSGSLLRGNVRLRLAPSQLVIKFLVPQMSLDFLE
jgi:predicted house-cleaning noncanonical NTP pyrophosphatase (MazG superfamily)